MCAGGVLAYLVLIPAIKFFGAGLTQPLAPGTLRGYATAHDCRHNRAQLYHVHHKALYRAIGEPESRLRRPLTLGHVIQRLMLLDAIVENPELVWLATTDEKIAHLTTLTQVPPEQLPHVTTLQGSDRATRYFPERLPIRHPPCRPRCARLRPCWRLH
jgi:hypothetical protein